MNVIGSRPDGWWRDRPAALRALLAQLQAYAAADGIEITMFVDGGMIDGVDEGAQQDVRVLYARRAGANAADDRMIEFIDGEADRSSLHAVTSDRALAGRLRARGVVVHGTSTLLEQLDALSR
jgi:predicted RNA-binding protein with PIN domain